MASKGSAKDLSVRQEDYIAKMFHGKRSKSSGAAEHDAGDVRCRRSLIECKVRMPTVKPLPMFVRLLETIAREAWESGQDPMLALRYYSPHSVLSNGDGWVDVVVMLAADAANREEQYEDSL